MTRVFADYMVFVDESGSPGMGNIDPHYPLFVLAFFIVKKRDYITQIAPALQQFKFQHFGHDQVILHERDIRKDLGDFAFLKTPALKDAFLGELTTLIEAAPFDLVCVVIDKARHKAQYKTPVDPYHLSLGFGLERVCGLLAQRGVWRSGPAKPGGVTANPAVHVVVEKRGKSEDDDLELEFRRICDGANYNAEQWNFEVIFADKKSNSAGLQLADLVARPIGMSVLKPGQPNRAFEAVKPKFLQKSGRFMGWGLKCFP
jgi:hypothetical protein